MKNLFLFFISFLFSYNLYAQQWVDIGLKYGPGTSWLINQNLLNDNQNQYLLSFAQSYGAKFGYNISYNVELTLDYMISSHNQDYSFIGYDGPFNHNIFFKTHDLALLFRYNGSGNYFELGPQWSRVKEVSAPMLEDPLGIPYLDISDDILITDSYYSLVTGFGAYFFGTENLGVTLGMRFVYGFNDLITEEGNNTTLQTSYPSMHITYEEYKPTNPLSVYLIMELNYDLGYIAKNDCGKRVKFLTF